MNASNSDTRLPPHGVNNVAPYVLLALAVLSCAWWFWVGLMLARLWHYGGALHGPFEKFDVQPECVRERLARQKMDQELTGIPLPILDVHQWQSNVLAYDDKDLEKLPVDVRRKIVEETRISRMPAFVADDCADETLFPDVPPAIPAQEYNELEFGERLGEPNPIIKDYRAMGLRKLGRHEWLAHAVDMKEYLEHYEARKRLLATKYDECIQIMPDGEDACVELLEEVVAFLTKEKSHWFQLEETYGERKIHNKVTGERWGLQRPYPRHPLEICARLCMEDFNILVESPFSGKHTLAASATCAPSGWQLLRQLGRPTTNSIEPPLSWDNFSKILELFRSDDITTPPLKRTHLFVQTDNNSRGLSDLLFITERHHFFPGNLSTLHHHLMLRKERQSFRTLPKSGAIVFTTRTRIRAVKDLRKEELESAVREIKAWPADIATLKGRDLWGSVLEHICMGKPAFRDDRTVYADSSSSEA